MESTFRKDVYNYMESVFKKTSIKRGKLQLVYTSLTSHIWELSQSKAFMQVDQLNLGFPKCSMNMAKMEPVYLYSIA